LIFGTRTIPVLTRLAPVQLIVVHDFFIWIELEPSLAALLFLTRIPSQTQNQQTPTGKFNQKLLKRINTKRILDLVVPELTVQPSGSNHEPVTVHIEG